jgi:hypothetical protein
VQANVAMAVAAFGFLLAAHLGLQMFAPVISSAQLAQLAERLGPSVQPDDMVCIHGEYESGSTLGFYLRRPTNYTTDALSASGVGPHLLATNPICIVEGRSSNLWYGSFFPDAPKIFVTPDQLAARWKGPQRIFLWQSLTDPPNKLPPGLAPVYVIAEGGGKEIVSNQPADIP